MGLKLVHASLFTGIGACELAAERLGWENAFSCEIDDWCNAVLKFHYPNEIHYGDIKTTDFTQWRGKIDVLSGGFPCQGFSCAGKRRGTEDDRYLWPEMLRVIRQVRPRWVVGENVNGILSMVLPGEEVEVGGQGSLFAEGDKETLLVQQYVIDRICEDIEREGYRIIPTFLPACATGAPHERMRVWFLAHNDRDNLAPDTDDGGTLAPRQVSGPEGRGGGDDGIAEERLPAPQRADGQADVRRADTDPTGVGWDEGRPEGDWEEQDPALRGDLLDEPQRPCEERPAPETCGDEEWPYPQDQWRDFPTQPPICSGNDELSDRLSGITFSKWRMNAIKALGNSMCVAVVFEIFYGIERTERKLRTQPMAVIHFTNFRYCK